MTVKELIEHLQKFPQDALVICTMCSDYAVYDEDDITLMEPKDGGGLINHYGHVMYLPKNWRQDNSTVKEFEWEKRVGRAPEGVTAADPPFITAVHFRGN